MLYSFPCRAERFSYVHIFLFFSIVIYYADPRPEGIMSFCCRNKSSEKNKASWRRGASAGQGRGTAAVGEEDGPAWHCLWKRASLSGASLGGVHTLAPLSSHASSSFHYVDRLLLPCLFLASACLLWGETETPHSLEALALPGFGCGVFFTWPLHFPPCGIIAWAPRHPKPGQDHGLGVFDFLLFSQTVA